MILSGALLPSIPAAHADSFLTFSQPTADYTSGTINYGAGDGSGNAVTSLGPFSFSDSMVSVPMQEYNVPDSWGSWGAPPATESATPNVLYSNGVDSLTIQLDSLVNVVGFEYEPDAFQAEQVSAAFYNADSTLITTLTLEPSGDAGALLFALEDTSIGQSISFIQLSNNFGDDFAIAQLRTAFMPITARTPEPASLPLLASGIFILLALFRRQQRTE